MKSVVIFVIMCTVIFFSAGIVNADEISDLKEQLKALQATVSGLNAKIQTLETKQEAQVKETAKTPQPDLQETVNALNAKIQTLETKQEAQAEQVKNVPELVKKVNRLDELKEKAKDWLGGVTVGGNLKIAIFDRTQGKRNGVNQHNNGAAGFIGPDSPLRLTFGKALADWLRLDVRTLIEANASATPSLGSNISRTTNSAFSTSVELAYLTAILPKGYQLRFGQMRPLFSEDYAKETWWEELYNLPLKTCTLQGWHDFGAELYKNFDFDKWSLPVYFYALNGSHLDNTDADVIHNNESKTVLFHVAPEFFQTKLRLLGSFGYGKWDSKSKEDMFRAAYGLEWKYKKFNLRGEYIYNLFKNVVVPSGDIVPTADGRNEGYWVKAIYTFNPRWRAVVEESYANLYQAALTATQKTMLSDKWYTTSLALDYSLTPNSIIIGQYDISDGHRSDGSESLKFNRFTLGWRTSF